MYYNNTTWLVCMIYLYIYIYMYAMLISHMSLVSKVPNTVILCSDPEANSFTTWTKSRLSVKFLRTYKIIKWFNLFWVIVLLKYAGMTIISLVRVHTSLSKHCWDGDKPFMQANTSCMVGLMMLFSAKWAENSVSYTFNADGSKSLPYNLVTKAYSSS